MADHVATADVEIAASATRVWTALTDPVEIKTYFFGTDVETDWKPGSVIVWRGEYEGSAYEDKGEIVEVEPGRRLKMTHFSPMTGQADEPENYHTLTYDLTEQGAITHVSLSQDNNPDEKSKSHSEKNWTAMLDGLKKYVEQ